MPYRCAGNLLMHKKGGKWSVKQKCRSSESCHAAMRLLQGVEHGWKPKSQSDHYAKALKQ